jgi:hypothetical protein
MSDARIWWPEFLLDEVMREGRAKPEDWLAPDENGVTAIRWDEDQKHPVAGRLVPGSEAAFIWYEPRGIVDVIIKPDGTWSHDDDRDTRTPDMFTGQTLAERADRAAIADANAFWSPGEPETFADSLDEFARGHADMETLDPDGERVTVKLGFWSESIRFRVSLDGKSLAPVPAADADNGGDNG